MNQSIEAVGINSIKMWKMIKGVAGLNFVVAPIKLLVATIGTYSTKKICIFLESLLRAKNDKAFIVFTIFTIESVVKSN